MDANHFRDRAAKAREMARSGDDLRLAEMLLEVAFDLESEAEAIEAEQRAANLRTVPLPQATVTWFRGVHVTHRDAPPASPAPAAKRWTTAAEPIMFGVPETCPVRA